MSNILRLFSKCIIKYATEFQKWYLPLNIKTWFSDIFKDQPTGLIPLQATSNFFSQPLLRTVSATNGAQTYSSQPQELTWCLFVLFTQTNIKVPGMIGSCICTIHIDCIMIQSLMGSPLLGLSHSSGVFQVCARIGSNGVAKISYCIQVWIE